MSASCFKIRKKLGMPFVYPFPVGSWLDVFGQQAAV